MKLFSLFTTLLLIQLSYGGDTDLLTETKVISECCEAYCPLMEWGTYCPSGEMKTLQEMEQCMGGIFPAKIITEETLFRKCNKPYRELKKCVCDGHTHGPNDNTNGQDLAYQCCSKGCSISHIREFCGKDNRSQFLRIKGCIVDKKLLPTELTDDTPIKMCPPRVRPLMDCICKPLEND